MATHFFPGTGHNTDKGVGEGQNYSLNFPLNDGMDDDSYRSIFRPVIQKVMEKYQPEAVVLCCGADSIAADTLGCWNLSVKGHSECLEYVKSFGIPMLVLGGGGYTPKNVARCWTYETSALLQSNIDDKLPFHDFFQYYAPDYKLHIPDIKHAHTQNLNSPQYLEQNKQIILDCLQQLEAVPGVSRPFAIPACSGASIPCTFANAVLKFDRLFGFGVVCAPVCGRHIPNLGVDHAVAMWCIKPMVGIVHASNLRSPTCTLYGR